MTMVCLKIYVHNIYMFFTTDMAGVALMSRLANVQSVETFLRAYSHSYNDFVELLV